MRERERTQDIKHQCDRLQFTQRDNKREIQDILSTTNSVEQHIYLEKGQTPEKINSYAQKTNARLAEEEQLADYFKHKRVPIPGVNKGVVGARGAPNILRTIHMPNQHASNASSETHRLTQQIE